MAENPKVVDIDFARVWRALLRAWPLALACALCLGCLGVFFAPFFLPSQDVYQARASVYCNVANAYGQAVDPARFAGVAKSMSVAQRAVTWLADGDLTADAVYGMIGVEYDTNLYAANNSAIVGITASAADPELAARVVNAVAEAFVTEMFPTLGNQDTMLVLDVAQGAARVVDALRAQGLFAAALAVVGALLCFGAVALREVFALRLLEMGDATLGGRFEALGAIPAYDTRAGAASPAGARAAAGGGNGFDSGKA